MATLPTMINHDRERDTCSRPSTGSGRAALTLILLILVLNLLGRLIGAFSKVKS